MPIHGASYLHDSFMLATCAMRWLFLSCELFHVLAISAHRLHLYVSCILLFTGLLAAYAVHMWAVCTGMIRIILVCAAMSAWQGWRLIPWTT